MRATVTFWLLSGIALFSGCASGDEFDRKLSTELRTARFQVLEWPPVPGSLTPSTSQPPHTKCALRLKDENTGTVYVLGQSTKRRVPAEAGKPSDWVEHGDYFVVKEGVDPSGATHLVRVECDSWKPLGMVPRRG